MAAEPTGLLHDATFWVAMASVLFGVVLWVKARKPVLGLVDARRDKIKADLAEAERLRNEAQDFLADIQKKHQNAIKTAEKIIAEAQDTAKRLQKDTQTKLDDSLKRREEQLLGRIERAETAAVAQMRDQAARIAVEAAEQVLTDMMPAQGGKLVEDSITGLSKAKLN